MSAEDSSSTPPPVRKLVNERVKSLQARFLADESTARAELAQLRHAARQEPGTIPAVWELTSYPVSDWAPDEPTPEERAVHDAMCLYAIAQQSNSYEVHKTKLRTNRVGFGDAMRFLAWQDGQEEPRFRRRFDAAVTSDSYSELLTHITALIRQIFHSKLAITMDFGSLAEELQTFQYPDGASRVRRRWARQYAAPNYSSVREQTPESDTSESE